jgi:hypothetical protein
MELERLSHPVGLAEYAPLFAQGFTTAHWGLEPFPPNLVGINISKDEFLKSDPALNYTAYTLPYNCSSDIGWYYKILNWTLYNGGIAPEVYLNVETYDVYQEITPLTPLCEGDDTCKDNGCIILVDGVGSTTTVGTASIVGLAHGLTSIIVFFTTLAAIFLFIREPCPEGGVNDNDLINYYRSPLRRLNPFTDEAYEPDDFATEPEVVFVEPTHHIEMSDLPTPQTFAEHVFRVRGLMTEWHEANTAKKGMRYAVPGEEQHRDNAQRRANILLEEIRTLVKPWPRMMEQTRVNWTDGQRRQAQAIVDDVNDMASPVY